MVHSNVTRVAAATGAVALAAAGVLAMGQGTASAAKGTYTWSDGNDGLTRTISDVTPTVGETITVWTTIQRNGGVVEYVQAAKDAHPACWQYVPGSAKVKDSAHNVESQSSGDANNQGWQRVTGSWPIYPNINPRTVWFEFKYVIGADCPKGVPLKGSFFYSGTMGDGNEQNVGPAVTVRANSSTTTTVDPVPVANVNIPVNITATITPAPGDGTVQFKDNGANIGSPVNVNANTGKATQSWTPVTGGNHAITAVYSGAASYDGSTSAAQNVNVINGSAGTGSLSGIFGS
jgi:hypothetical protein